MKTKSIAIGQVILAGTYQGDVVLGTGVSVGAGILSICLHVFPLGGFIIWENKLFNKIRIPRNFGIAFIKGGILQIDVGQINKERSMPKSLVMVELAELLGQKIYSEELEQEGTFTIEMPEGKYAAIYRSFVSVWRRPFGFTKRMRRIQIGIESGIPVPEKGGHDRVYSSTMPFEVGLDLVDAKIAFIQSINNHRMKEGGKDWTPDKHEAEKLINKIKNVG